MSYLVERKNGYAILNMITIFNKIIFATMELNKIFRDSNNNVYTRINAGDIADFEGNFISVVDGKAVCRLNGNMVPMPEVLYNA